MIFKEGPKVKERITRKKRKLETNYKPILLLQGIIITQLENLFMDAASIILFSESTILSFVFIFPTARNIDSSPYVTPSLFQGNRLGVSIFQ